MFDLRYISSLLHICVYRLDLILGKAGSKKPDEYVSKISLASRVVKVERSVCTAYLKSFCST